jgi:alkylhydroperoxidase family enzyme
MDMTQVAPEAYQAVLGLEKYCRANVDHTVLELIKLRASMLNGCAFCVDTGEISANIVGNPDKLQRLSPARLAG